MIITLHVCDGCGKKEQSKNAWEPPTGWRGYDLVARGGAPYPQRIESIIACSPPCVMKGLATATEKLDHVAPSMNE